MPIEFQHPMKVRAVLFHKTSKKTGRGYWAGYVVGGNKCYLVECESDDGQSRWELLEEDRPNPDRKRRGKSHPSIEAQKPFDDPLTDLFGGAG